MMLDFFSAWATDQSSQARTCEPTPTRRSSGFEWICHGASGYHGDSGYHEKIPGQNGIGCFLKLPSTAAVVNYDLQPKSVNSNQLASPCQSLQRNGPILKTLGKIMVAEGSFLPQSNPSLLTF